MKARVWLSIAVAGLIVSAAGLTAAYSLKEVPRAADVSMNGVYLSSGRTAKKILKKPNFICNMELHPDVIDLDRDVTSAYPHGDPCYYNQDRTEILGAFYGHGAYIDDFAIEEFQVRPALKPTNPKIPVLKNIKHFRSGRGIHLGMTPGQVKEIFGSQCLKTTNKDGLYIMEYALAVYGEPCGGKKAKRFAGDFGYYSTYVFKKGKLVLFDFGFGLDV